MVPFSQHLAIGFCARGRQTAVVVCGEGFVSIRFTKGDAKLLGKLGRQKILFDISSDVDLQQENQRLDHVQRKELM